MTKYEYKVVAAPTRGKKAKGVRTSEARFSLAIEDAMNAMAADGWEYQRAETLPSVERSGFTSSKTVLRHVLVFRRNIEASAEQPLNELNRTPPLVASRQAPLPEIVSPKTADDDASKSQGASRMLSDNGVEELSEVSGLTNSLTQLAESRSKTKSAE